MYIDFVDVPWMKNVAYFEFFGQFFSNLSNIR